jgi:hypothetical protein
MVQNIENYDTFDADEKNKTISTEENPGSYFRKLRNKFLRKKILEFLDADPDTGSGIFLTLDPGWIGDKHPGSATLPIKV